VGAQTPVNKHRTIVELCVTVLGMDVTTQFVEVIAHATTRLTASHRRELLCEILHMLGGASRRHLSERIAGAKVLAALMPESLESIRSILRTADDRWWYELHFTLFCFLDDVQSLPGSFHGSVYQIVKDYIRTARTRTAKAAWMAGDLLGGHWSCEALADDLSELVSTAQHVVGKESAIHGLEQLVDRVGEHERATIIEALEQIALTDKSEKFRISAVRDLGQVAGRVGQREKAAITKTLGRIALEDRSEAVRYFAERALGPK
jgi:hypothetical protein